MSDRLEYPDWYAIERETSFLYYAVCRHLAPQNVLETGIANGHSSFFLIQAMKKNGHGKLHSIDIADNVGKLLNEDEQEYWTLHVLGSPQRRSFSRILDSVSDIDLFVHDSDHTYGWQMFEFRAAWKALSKYGVLLSDDIDHSLAFVDFCNEIGQKPVLLLDTRKVTGMLLPEA
jgi:predicted O-methyltransferase YrrM